MLSVAVEKCMFFLKRAARRAGNHGFSFVIALTFSDRGIASHPKPKLSKEFGADYHD